MTSPYDQHQDDIGAEMSERELAEWEHDTAVVTQAEADEPDDQALVDALLAQTGYAVTDLCQIERVETLCDTDRDTMAQTVHHLDQMLDMLITTRDDVAQALAELMEGELELIGGHTVKRSQAIKTEWDRDGAWRAARASILERWAMSGGELDKVRAETVDRVLGDVATVYTTLNPTVNGLKALQVNPNEYRATTRATRWSVKIT